MENERKPLSYEELKALYKKRYEPTPFFYWTYYHDGRVETNFTPDLKPAIIQQIPIDERVIEESPKPVPIQLTCKRCGRSWIQRGKRKPMQCPKCKSPYWNRKRKS